MSIFDTFLSRFGYTKAQPDQPPPGEMLSIADGFRWDMPSAQTTERQLQLYAALTWIATAIDVPASIAADAVFSVKQVAGEPGGADDEDLPNHPFEQLLYRPNPSQSRGEFLRDAYTLFKTTGNLYVYLNARAEGAPPDELWLVPSHMIAPIPDGRSYVAGYKFTPPGLASEVIEPWKIVHLKTSNPLNPFVGLSALQSLALDAYGDLAQQKWNLAFFDKNNAKLPSILAFKQMIQDPEWNKLKAERDREWGGTNRSGVTLLRGVGDSLQLIQASATQKDMQALEQRGFAKEEIYGKLAPGLASILAVNATEANAIAGKATLIEFGVWPVLSQLAQKWTATILPLYGDNLIGEFDDIRQTNRILDLQEQQEFAKYHTINEVRSEYYDEEPLELDDSVVKIMQEKAQAKPAAPPPPAPNPFQAKSEPAADVSKLDPRGFLFAAQIGPSTPNPADVKPPAPEPPPAPPGQPDQPPMMQQPGDALPAETPPAGDMAAQAAEMKAWEAFALKRLGKQGGREFEPRAIDLFTAGRIRTALKTAATPADVRRVFENEQAPDALLARAVSALEKFNAQGSA